MTAPPLPTFVPQTEWYNLTLGGINPSEADSVPNITYLQPSMTALGLIDGLVGSIDGGVIYLAGLVSELDGGQKWLMWSAASMAVDDGINVFTPWADPTKPGRWVNTAVATTSTPVSATQIIEAGGTSSITASVSSFNNVFVKGRAVAGATTLNLPGTAFLGQTFTVKDSNGDAGTSNIIVTAPSIDGATTDTIFGDYGERAYTWNGSEWSVS